MVKNSREGNRERAIRRRAALADRGIKQILLMAPEQAHPLLKQAAGLMTRDDDPMDPRTALRQVGGANEPGLGAAPPDLIAELEAAKARIAEIERQAEARRVLLIEAGERRRQELEAERDAAVAAEAAVQAKASAMAKAAEKAAGDAQKALQRVKKAETTIRQVKALPGLKGRLVRWLAGDVLE